MEREGGGGGGRVGEMVVLGGMKGGREGGEGYLKVNCKLICQF